MKRIYPLEQQSAVDIAIQEAGTPEALFDVAMAAGISVTDVLSEHSFSPGDNVNVDVQDYYAKKGVKGVSSVKPLQQGIGYWQVGVDFIIN